MASNEGAHKRTTSDKARGYGFTRLIAFITGLAFFGFLLAPAPAVAIDATTTTGDQVCQGLDSGKIDTTGDPTTVTVTAPEGMLIDGYCVKAGSTNNGNGPVYVTVDPPAKTVTISYPGGKDISHYSLSYTTQPPDKVVYGEWVDGAKDCESKTVTQTRTKSVTTYKWVDGKWVAQTPVVTTETRTRPMTDAELKECSPQPPDKVVYGEWVDGAKDCESKTVTQTRTKSVTTYKWVDGKWVAQTPVVTTETRTRPMTDAELKECSPQPPDKVVYGEWVDGAKDCESKTVTQTRTKSVTTYKWVDGKWVAQTPVVTTETRTRPMTPAEVQACTPPVVVPPVTPPVVVPPVVTPPFDCPSSMMWVDMDHDGVEEQGECKTPVKGAVKKLDKCEHNNFFKAARVKGAHYMYKGKVVREGVWLKAQSKVVKIKLVADSAKYVVKGQSQFVLRYPNKASCSPVVNTPPPTGV